MNYVTVPPEQLPADVLSNLMEEYIGREGTDYGEVTMNLAQMMELLRQELSSGRAVIVYDLDEDTCNIIPARELARLAREDDLT